MMEARFSRSKSAKGQLVVLAHDYLTQRGGAERVTLELWKAVQPNFLYAALYDPARTFPEFAALPVQTSFLNKIPPFRKDPRRALPLLKHVWNNPQVRAADVVVCSSSGWSHGVRTAPHAKKIVYCHNPPRWIYQSSDYLEEAPPAARCALALLRKGLLEWDRRAAASVDVYIANSTSVADRIERFYGRKPKIAFPPICIDTAAAQKKVAGLTGRFFLTIGRPRGYKGTHLLVEAVSQMLDVTLVVVGGGQRRMLASNVVNVGRVSDEELRWLYSNARALISVSKEDFGLTPIEANAFGTPALLLRAGGFLDSTVEGISGRFIEKPTIAAVQAAISAFPTDWDKGALLDHAERFKPAAFHAQIREIIAETVSP